MPADQLLEAGASAQALAVGIEPLTQAAAVVARQGGRVKPLVTFDGLAQLDLPLAVGVNEPVDIDAFDQAGVTRARQLELIHLRGHAHCRLAHHIGRGCRFFNQGGVGLGVAVQLRHSIANLPDAQTLFTRAIGHLAEQVLDLLGMVDDVVHVFAGLQHDVVAFGHFVGAAADQRLDLFGGRRAAPGQRPHLGRHHRKTATLLARAGSLHGRVERQNIGLERNAVNHPDDVANALGRRLNVRHGVCYLLHHRATLAGGIGIVRGNPGSLGHRVGRHGHGGIGLFQRG